MDVATVILVTALALALFVLIRRWMDRDLALSFAGDDPAKRAHMLDELRRAKAEGVRRKDLPGWLEAAAGRPSDAAPGTLPPP